MRIWIVNPFDDIPGEGAKQRYWTIAETLAARGHEVTWWSSRWSHRRKARRIDSNASKDLLKGADLRLVEAPPYLNNVSLARWKSHHRFARNLKRLGNEQLKDAPPQLVMVSWPPMETAKVAMQWRMLCGCRVVLDVMDAWPDNFLMLAPRLPEAKPIMRTLLKPWLKQAQSIFQKVDAVSAQSETFAQWACQRGAVEAAHVCYLGASASASTRESVRVDYGNELRLLYLGAMGRAYDLATLLRAVAQLGQQGVAIRLDLAGQGDQEPELRELAHELQLDQQVTFHGYLQGEAFEQLLANAHVGIIPMQPDSLVAVPYKAGEYLGAGLPIINSLTGELQSLLAKHACGDFYRVGDVNSLAQVIRGYVNQPERLTNESRAALALFQEKFDRDQTYLTWAKWLESVA